MRSRRSAATPQLDAAALVEVRAALAAGASPAAAVAAAAEPALPEIARSLRLGTPLRELVADGDTGDARADLLLRALAVTEHAGTGAVDAVDQALRAAREERDVARLLHTRTTQARGTALLLTALPLVVTGLLVLLGGAPLGYYATPVGRLTGALAVVLLAAGWWCARRLVARAADAAARADPLMPAPAPRQPWRLALLVPPAAVLGGGLAGRASALGAVAIAVAAALRRPSRPPPSRGGGAAEAVELVAVALRAGLPTSAALGVVGGLAPPLARAPLRIAARRVSGGWTVGAALAGTGLTRLGAVLAAAERWGAPAAPALAALADELRAERRAAAEAAAERAQLALIFPTTLLTLPAFALAVVPPMIWQAFAGLGHIAR